jgi:lipid-A-disaccharide synthase
VAAPVPGARILLVAGEPSGDRHGAALATELLRHPDLEGIALEGIAGPLMRAAGVRALVPMEDLAVVGVVEVLSHLPALLAARRALDRCLADGRTRLFLPIDFPGFNLPLCAAAHRKGVPVLYYIAPQVWAWGKDRLPKMAKTVDHLAAVFPFEEPLYRGAGVPVTYVGHPLVESLDPEHGRAAFLAELGWPADTRFAALLPGSRDGELARLADPLLGFLIALAAARPDARGILAAASPGHAARLSERVRATPAAVALGDRLRVVEGRTRETLAHARAAVVASGTATLECAALGTPLVAVYRLARPTYWLARRLVRLERFALCNIVAGEDVAPELLQDAVAPDRILDAFLPLWDEGATRTRALERAGRVRAKLGAPGASARTAELAAALVRRGGEA